MAYIGKSPSGSGVRTRYYYTAVGGETSISGVDDNGRTLSFTDAEYVDVYVNGVLLVAGTDYGTGTPNTISSITPLAADDIVEILVFDIYTIAKINSEAARRRYYFTATGGETSVSGTDDNGQTISFAANSEIEVSINGISIVQGVDYNTSAANTVGGLSALSAGQVVEIIVYERFVLTDTVSKRDGGTFSNNIVVDGNLTVTGTVPSLTMNNGIYLGGTGSDNLLDDYEEGTWTPVATGGPAITVASSRYVKIGNLCTASAYIVFPSNSDPDPVFITLPFSVTSITNSYWAVWEDSHYFKNNQTFEDYMNASS
ncbi:hypothetical protein N8704_01335 [bacterium]|nr:hypothetical protein [bacterium]